MECNLIINEEEDGSTVVPDIKPGVYFDPKDEELIQYLNKKINKEPIKYECIPSINLYKNSPHELTGAYSSLGRSNEWYFFTTRNRKYLNGKRPDRTTGNGYWKATGADKCVYDRNNVCIGYKRSLAFYEGKPPKEKKTNWLMHEYVVDQPASKQHNDANDMLLDSCVLCRIYMNSRGLSTKEDATISCQIKEQETNECSKSENLQATSNKRMKIGHDNVDLLVQQQQNFPAALEYGQSQNLDGSLYYFFGSTSDDVGRVYIENPQENASESFLVDPKPADASCGDCHLLNNSTPCTLMDSFGPSLYSMDDLWNDITQQI
ncbi:NAC domain-containing protein 72-like [Primulina eburnea]|uniref:NAC domain-containing protein 72-like n=1 Tax=Primulina eburnea TaxID=1245227 RepID=UPI003C6C82F5